MRIVNEGKKQPLQISKFKGFRLTAGHFLCWPKESNPRKGLESPGRTSDRTATRAFFAAASMPRRKTACVLHAALRVSGPGKRVTSRDWTRQLHDEA
jgi:hypothetical protein